MTAIAPNASISCSDRFFQCLNNPATKRAAMVACGAITSFATVIAFPAEAGSSAILGLSIVTGGVAAIETWFIYTIAQSILNGGYREHPLCTAASIIVVIAKAFFAITATTSVPAAALPLWIILESSESLLFGALAYQIGELFSMIYQEICL